MAAARTWAAWSRARRAAIQRRADAARARSLEASAASSVAGSVMWIVIGLGGKLRVDGAPWAVARAQADFSAAVGPDAQPPSITRVMTTTDAATQLTGIRPVRTGSAWHRNPSGGKAGVTRAVGPDWPEQ